MSYTATHGALGRKLPAHAVVNQFSSDRLASIFRELGQERHAKLIAREIERRRAQKPIATTAQLVEAILAAVPRRYTKELHIHPATRVFQSLRIFVNDELGQLKSALDAATAVLNPGGRLAVVSFHSLEDSIVKKYFRSLCAADISASQQDRPLQPGTADAAQGEEPSIMDRSHDEATDLHKSFQMLTKRAIKPGPEELQLNPRSRSSRLRVIERVY
ncbi:hypothetical protein GGI12_006226 [Dipsacomyces acuminosporus]|nr:hypothetical protein GGI12_006226 [Dipsacomyces acuminosporus]